MHAMSCIIVNAVRNAMSYKAYQPEKVLETTLRLVPDLDNVALIMINRYLFCDSWEFDCPHSEKISREIANKLVDAVDGEIKKRKLNAEAD